MMLRMFVSFLRLTLSKRFSCAVVCMLLATGAMAQKNVAPKSPIKGDFIVAVVDTFPITNHEVRSRANEIRQDLLTQNGTAPTVDVLLKEALEKLIEEKALLQNAKDTGVEVDTVSVEQAEERQAAQAQMSLQDWRKNAMSEGKTLAQVQQGLREQLLLQKLAERNVPARIKVSDQEIDAAVKAQQSTSNAPQARRRFWRCGAQIL